MKKILCAALLIACCLLSLPFAMADETLTDGDWTFTVDRKGVVSLSGYTGEETSLTLPEVLGGYTVTRVANKAFQGNTAIKMVVIPDCYTSIGHRAFENCTRLQKLTLGGGISDWTLDWGYNGAFAGCTNLFEIDFAPGITSIGAAAFKNCTLLDMVILPDTVTVVADSAFENCELLDIVEVYGNIEAAAFKNCSYMSMLTIHNAENIGNNAFQGCTSIKKIVLPETLTAIGNEAFKGCSQLREMIIPDAVETVGFRAFADCLQLQKLVVGASVTKWQKDWGDSSAFGNCPALKDVTVKAGVTLLPTKAFRDCIRLQTVTLPEGMVTLEDEVFLNCAKLETVIFPATLQTIGNSAFNNCPALKTAKLPKALVSIGNSAFRGTALTEVIIPAKTVTIGCYAFRDCLALTHVVLGEQVTNWTEDWGNNGAFDNCTALKTLVIESGVNSIGAYAFRGCTALESVEVPSTSICVGEAAFKDCTGLKDAVVYRGVIEAGALKTARRWRASPFAR